MISIFALQFSLVVALALGTNSILMIAIWMAM
jgi:hypothetical protein